MSDSMDSNGIKKIFIIDGIEFQKILDIFATEFGVTNRDIIINIKELIACLFSNDTNAKCDKFFVSVCPMINENPFYKFLKGMGFMVIKPDNFLATTEEKDSFRRMEINNIIEVKASMDDVDEITLLSGTNHFVASLTDLKNAGKKIWIVGIPGYVSEFYLERFLFYDLNIIKDRIVQIKKKKNIDSGMQESIQYTFSITGECDRKTYNNLLNEFSAFANGRGVRCSVSYKK